MHIFISKSLQRMTKYLKSIRVTFVGPGWGLADLEYQLAVLQPKNVCHINWNCYQVHSKNSLSSRNQIFCQVKSNFFDASYLCLILIKSFWIPLLLLKNFKVVFVVLNILESLYMNGSNFSSSQHKLEVRQVW